MKSANRKAYLAPSAEVICLVPSENIASSGWTFGSNEDNWTWNSQLFKWGDEAPKTASITANILWTDEIDLNE